MSVNPDKCDADSFVGLFLHGFNTQKGLQWRERADADALGEFSLERFMALQRIDILAVERGMKEAGFVLSEEGNILEAE